MEKQQHQTQLMFTFLCLAANEGAVPVLSDYIYLSRSVCSQRQKVGRRNGFRSAHSGGRGHSPSSRVANAHRKDAAGPLFALLSAK